MQDYITKTTKNDKQNVNICFTKEFKNKKNKIKGHVQGERISGKKKIKNETLIYEFFSLINFLLLNNEYYKK